MQELVGVCKWVGDYYFNLTFSLPFFTLTFQSRFVEAMLGEQVGVCGWVGGYSFDLAFFFLSSLSLSNSKIFTFLSILTIVEVICARASGRLWMSRWVLLFLFLLSLSLSNSNFHFHFPIQILSKRYVREPVGVCGWVGGYYSATASSASRRPLLQLCNRWKRKKEKCEHRIFNSNQLIFLRMH